MESKDERRWHGTLRSATQFQALCLLLRVCARMTCTFAAVPRQVGKARATRTGSEGPAIPGSMGGTRNTASVPGDRSPKGRGGGQASAALPLLQRSLSCWPFLSSVTGAAPAATSARKRQSLRRAGRQGWSSGETRAALHPRQTRNGRGDGSSRYQKGKGTCPISPARAHRRCSALVFRLAATKAECCL
jgi:hypothetical protein